MLPWHRDLDSLEEARLADKKYGSTKQGIAPFYSDKYQKKTIMAGELLYPEKLWDHLAGILEWKNLTLERVYGAKPYTMDDLKAWVAEFGEKIKPFICDTGAFLRQAQAEASTSCLRPSWAPCGIWTTASTPTPPPPTPSRRMPLWAPACPPPSWTRSSVW